MKIAIVLILCGLIAACDGQQSGGGESYYYNQITGWQSKELEYRDFEEADAGERMSRDEVWNFLRSLNVRYVGENKDRWQDSLETESAGGGDCEDLANYYLLRLMDSGRFADRDVICLILDLEKAKQDHVVLTVRDRQGVWWVFDQNNAAPYPWRLERYLDLVSAEIILAYNLFDIWEEDFPQFAR
jgi:hypothetical protein